MKKRSIAKNALRRAVLVAAVAGAAACGGASVEGNTYVDNLGIVKFEFQADGKVFVSTGPVTTPCSYSESGKNLTLTCEGDVTEFTIDDDGALSGPPGGMVARLTKQE